jgi:hypothetical protein
MIAPPRSFHEILLHVAPRRRRGRMDALTEYGEAALTDRSVFGSAPRSRGTIAFRPDRSGDGHA